ncbi:hypothetical protein N7G274_006910 [Stereocaulon virgatum]|uniref:DEAD/DEAH box helicase domain-containing protein n=1 Tax=Stereocaulon virgatum TaxID=373712 RepID=A0ABR4A3G7_9LECA
MPTSSTKRTIPPDFDDESTAKRVKATEDAIAVALAKGILQRTWGFPNFKLKQEAAIARLMSGDSATVVFPSGGGKILVSQIPAPAFDDCDELCGRTSGKGVILVVSPLIALMEVANLINPP